MNSSSTRELLEALLASNVEEDIEGLFPQEVEAPGNLDAKFSIPCLDGCTFKVASPMLIERFKFAGRWVNAYLGQTWLSVSDMATLGEGPEWEQVKLRRLYYENSVVSSVPLDRLTLFGVDTIDGGETYLLWTDNEEPEILEFCGGAGQEDRHENLNEFVNSFIVGLTSD